MHDPRAICEKIQQLYPDIGECGIDIDVCFDDTRDAWVVDLKRGNQHLKTYMDHPDADSCMLGKKCVGLGIEIAQLRGNVERLNEAMA